MSHDLLSRPDLTREDWAVVRRIYRRVFYHGVDPNGLRATWTLWLSGIVALVLNTYGYGWWRTAGAVALLAVVGRACWRAGHQEGYEVGFDEGFERGWFGASGIDWRREDLYDD